MFNYGALVEVDSLAVVGGSFHELAHASAPAAFATGPLKKPLEDKGAPVRGIVIVFTHQHTMDFVHTGRWLVKGCACSGGCAVLRSRLSARGKRSAKRARTCQVARAREAAAAASVAEEEGEDGQALGRGDLRRSKRARVGVGSE